MKYVTLYLAAGLLVLAIVLLQQYLEKRRSGPSAAELFDELRNQNKSAWIRSVQDIIVSAIAGLSVVALWPVAVFFLIKSFFSNRKAAKRREDAEFRISEQDLLEQLTVEKIEQRERIVDPQQAVPDLPFGHLHETWTSFLGSLSEGDALWSFRATHEPLWGGTVEKAGYVAVNGDRIGPYFLTLERKMSAS